MDIIGIIAEYNPFHNGHLYQIKKIKKMYPDSLIIAVMNGQFSQRGIPCIIDKWKRTRIALENGIDLVLELPFVFSVQSADIFASGAISILNEVGVKKLVFGSETNDVNLLSSLADIQLNNKDYERIVSSYIDKGYNYPTSMSKALEKLSKFKIEKPNDILALSYIKEIKKNNYDIEAISIKRTNDYKDEIITSSIASATAIRKALEDKCNIKDYVPKYNKDDFSNIYFLEDYFNIFKYKVMSDENLEKYQTVDEGIENRIKKYIVSCNSFKELTEKIKTKRYTYNRLNRMYIHILCNFTKDEAKKYKNIEYIRILGFNDLGKKYLNKIKKEVSLPIVSRYASLKNNKMLDLEYRSSKIYHSIKESNKDLIEEEYKKVPIYNK